MIRVAKVSWSSVCDELRCTFEGDEVEIKADVMAGVATCWRFGNTAMITRKDDQELVVMCLAGSDLKQILPKLFEAGRKGGCKTIRFHTKRLALGRHLREFGFLLDEYIFRADL